MRANYLAVRRRVDAACKRVGRAESEVTLIAVRKGHPSSSIEAAYEAGCLDFGENKVQEWADKQGRLSRRIRWHFIGHLQRNKVKYLGDDLTLIHSLDSVRLARELEKRAGAPQDVLLQVNIGSEEQKGGVEAGELDELARLCAKSPVLRAVGLMCIPPFEEDPEKSRPRFKRMRTLLDETRQVIASVDEYAAQHFVELSMGMSSDYEVAVEEGATLVRVGTAIMGEREY
ncbi:MAG: YggS family pyridoxal phosphate-dependent enzyme [Myxococcales bacterium]|nr:YggS family pyridoxal phosphate-dependent enzyme [Myxococcales bacterium]